MESDFRQGKTGNNLYIKVSEGQFSCKKGPRQEFSPLKMPKMDTDNKFAHYSKL